MVRMFYGAKKFNQSLDNWDIHSIKYISGIFKDSGLWKYNYCKLFEGKSKAIWRKYKSELGVSSSYECN